MPPVVPFSRLRPVVIGNITLQYWGFWLGLALVLLVLFVRGGLIGLVRTIAERRQRGRAENGI